MMICGLTNEERANGTLCRSMDCKACTEFRSKGLAPRLFGFGEAIHVLQRNGKITRDGWNDKGQYVCLQCPDENSKMTQPYMYLKNAQGGLIPWIPSQGDVLTYDWKEMD